MNRQAVALAADSAVTVQTEGGGKVWQSANKIFGLSRDHSIGIMLYGAAELMGLPWETAIKAYRDQLDPAGFDTVEEYAADLSRFVAAHRKFFPKDVQSRLARARIGSYFLWMRDEMIERVDAAAQKGPVTKAESTTIVSAVVDEHHATVSGRPYFDGFTASVEQRLKTLYRDEIDTAKRDIFQALPLTSGQSRKLTTIGRRLLCRVLSSGSMSGLVVAGFGNEEMFPTLESLFIEGIVGNRLMTWREPSAFANRENPSNIRAFAQSDMAVSFMEGVDPRYQDTIDNLAERIFQYYPAVIVDNIPSLNDKQKKEMKQTLAKVATETFMSFRGTLATYRQNTFTGPIVQVVSMLPKDELASMAEALVNLTSFRRKISMQLESVGGPIDVAVISKGDGFIWVNRKTYFKLADNPHFMARYQ